MFFLLVNPEVPNQEKTDHVREIGHFIVQSILDNRERFKVNDV